MHILIKLVLTLLLCTTGLSNTIYTPTVQTESGPVRGEILKTVRKSLKYASFRGIPFAEPPTKDLRFKPPLNKKKWTTVLNATKDGNVCIQYVGGSSGTIGSEDCLFINVYTPHTNFTAMKNNLKAVMVWIYGGGFTSGTSLKSVYGPDFLLEDDVVVVAFNYRLGPLGFLNLNHKNASGNVGLKDQHLALKWIQQNIKNFGGDSNKVTIFGQSAGAVSVDLHVLSNMSAGLFSQSISMSGSPLCLFWGFQTSKEAESHAFALGSKLGIKTHNTDELLQALLTVSADDIMTKAIELNIMPFRPTIETTFNENDESVFLSQCSINKYLSGNYTRKPHIMGFTSNEAKSFFSDENELLMWMKIAMEYLKKASIPLDISEFQSAISAGTLANMSETDINKLIKIGTDIYFITGIDSKLKFLNVKSRSPTFYYRFSFEPSHCCGHSNANSFRYNIKGVGHGEDLQYLLYMSSVGLAINQTDVELTTDRYVRLFTNFAKYGHPTPFKKRDDILSIKWPSAGVHGFHLDMNSNLSIGLRPINENVVTMETAGVGNSLLLTDCLKSCS